MNIKAERAIQRRIAVTIHVIGKKTSRLWQLAMVEDWLWLHFCIIRSRKLVSAQNKTARHGSKL
jgi:hypothetical protein